MLHKAGRESRASKIAWIAFACFALAVILAAATFYVMGGRWFVVQTPSMGEYAPVGTLVLSSLPGLAHLVKGEVILFHPPTAPSEVYFHRIYSISGGAIYTKGDINGAVDPWTLHSQDLIGTEVGRVAGIGWLIEALPLLLIGGLILWAITRFYVIRYWRFPIRVLGWAVLLSLAAFLVRPFVRAVLLSQTVSHGKATSRIVATGIFDLNAQAFGGNTATLAPGQVGSVVSDQVTSKGLFEIDLSPNLGLTMWLILIAIWIIPTVLCLIYSIRRPAHLAQ